MFVSICYRERSPLDPTVYLQVQVGRLPNVVKKILSVLLRPLVSEVLFKKYI